MVCDTPGNGGNIANRAFNLIMADVYENSSVADIGFIVFGETFSRSLERSSSAYILSFTICKPAIANPKAMPVRVDFDRHERAIWVKDWEINEVRSVHRLNTDKLRYRGSDKAINVHLSGYLCDHFVNSSTKKSYTQSGLGTIFMLLILK